MNALLYLSWTSARNRFLGAFRRVRSPRYAAALIVGSLYIWSFLFRSPNRGATADFLLGRPSQTLITLLMVLTLAGAWVFGADVTALAFSQAEVSMLFPAPLSRRQLIGLKLFRSQIAVLINTLIWVFVLRRGGNLLPSPLRALSLWILFSTLNLHRLGAALVQAAWKQHGRIGARRNRYSIAAFAFIGLFIVAGLVVHRSSYLGRGIGEFFSGLSDVLSSQPATIGLYPFHLIVAPTFAHSIAEWRVAVLPAIGMFLLHVLWVMRTDVAFEDAAIEASAERARRIEAFRGRRSFGTITGPKAGRATLRLAAKGHPALAIFWKNMLCLQRTVQLRLFVGPLAMAIAFGAAVASAGGDTAGFVSVTSATFALMMVVFGGRLIRNDLRHDMLHLPMLKSLPVAPSHVVFAEVASAALPMAALQLVLVVISYFASLLASRQPIPASIRLAVVVASPVAVLAINGALITVQNGMAVLFPAWVRLGSGVSTGVEALGQNVLAMMANLVTLGIALIPPMIVAWTSVLFLNASRGLSLAFVLVVASIVLAIETYGAMLYLGRSLKRVEPLQTV